MAKVEPKKFKGHVFYEGAHSMTPYEVGAFYYMVAYQFQNGPGHPGGSASTSGLVYPADKTQYGALVEDILTFVRQSGMGSPGYQVIMFFDIKENTEYRDPYVVKHEEAERVKKDAADQAARRKTDLSRDALEA